MSVEGDRRTTANAAPLLAGDPRRLGDYELVGRLGAGGQGSVYLGHRTGQPGELVAVKLLHSALAQDEAARSRFVREVSAAKRVAQFCAAQVLAADVAGHRPYIVTEYVAGPSLHELVRERGPLTGGALDRIAIGTATALVAIHQVGIVHRDLKPANVLLGPDGPRVIDFGIAKALDVTQTVTNVVVGTPAYMAPEQLRREPAGPASDVFAWAGTIVFMATGRPPFGNDLLPAVSERILNQEPDLGDMSGRLRELVAVCLAKDPARRPTAHLLLLQLLGQDTAPAVAPPPRQGEHSSGVLAAGTPAEAEQRHATEAVPAALLEQAAHIAAAKTPHPSLKLDHLLPGSPAGLSGRGEGTAPGDGVRRGAGTGQGIWRGKGEPPIPARRFFLPALGVLALLLLIVTAGVLAVLEVVSVDAASLFLAVVVLASALVLLARSRDSGRLFVLAAALVALSAAWAGAAGQRGFDSPKSESSSSKPPARPPSASPTVKAFPPPRAGRTVPNDKLLPGDCVKAPQVGTDKPLPDLVDITTCTSNHDAEVTFVGQLWAPNGRNPGEKKRRQQTTSRCEAELSKYVGTPYKQSVFDYAYWFPSETTWGNGDRQIVCMAYYPKHGLHYTIKGIQG
ncbi:serine/threonine-protein kinase [Actinomadura rubrisoli]|uniref:serine/threonine-protein kinase n=1 Tax=Actinomadura rubrisoli TaxID=2530368 RepID=UPI001404E64C|nr:serine/threonine-protein kinase [Actinomadura rubrisoli]